jgi:septal ring factor EnvC (AmiA/AmiB activator)
MRSFLLLTALTAPCSAVEERVAANPIRKVVTMLQMMQKKVEAEGEKEQDMHDKFMCYCKNGVGDLEKSIADAEQKSGELPSQIEEAEGELAQLKEDLKKAQVDRAAAKTAIEEATAIREKEAAAFATESGELKTNIAAIGKAVAALEKGMGGAFLQTTAADTLKKLVLNSETLQDVDREDLTSFLAGEATNQYAPQSGAITGILKQMSDTMSATLADITKTEEASLASFDQLVKAKTEEIDALTAAIEDKTQRIGDLGVQIVGMKDDLSDVEESLVEDKKFLAELQKSCATKEKEWAEICKTRSEELLALADTIKILNDDDALELFKKTLPGASSFLQVQVSSDSMRAQAISLLETFKTHKKHDRQRVDFILMAIRGKKVGFEKIIKTIDDMVVLLKEEQVDDENKKEYCETSFDQADDKKKGLERAVGKLEKAIDEAKDTIATLIDEIKALGDGIVALDKSVAEATEQRKEENSDFTTLMASDGTAKEILAFAKNRLNKFYNPKLYKAPPKRELSEEDRITLNMGGTLAPTAAPGGIAGTGIGFAQRVAPGPPPETAKAYSKKSEESGGVIAMIDSLIKELDTEMTEAETNEKLNQEDYEEMMADSAAKRAADSKSLSQKDGQKAETQAALVDYESERTSTAKELMATVEYIGQLHGECDWLIKYFDVRKEARTGEIEALGKAKAVLNGADYSLMQTKSHTFLRRA